MPAVAFAPDTVFRIESPDGFGPYNGDAHSEAYREQSFVVLGLLERQEDQPLPGEEFGVDRWKMTYDRLTERWRFTFGFPNKPAHSKWFDQQERRFLRDHGFILNEYEVEGGPSHRSRHQVIFDRQKARFVKSHPIDD